MNINQTKSDDRQQVTCVTSRKLYVVETCNQRETGKEPQT